MILASLADAAEVEALGPRFAAALAWLRAAPADLPDGRHEIDGDRVFALAARYETGPSTEKRFESHRAHADVQLVADGAERILHAPAARLTVAEAHDPAADVTWYAEPSFASSLLMTAGDLAVFLPGDAHKPGCMAGGRHAVRKIVVKVRLDG